jgi:pyruvate,water dikinase
MARVISSSDATGAAPRLLGGKGANLAQLVRRGFLVPPWFAVTTNVFASLRDAVRDEVAALDGLTRGDMGAIATAGRRIADALRARDLDPSDRDDILAAFDTVFGRDAWVAVRSSVVGEDSATSSFAGQMDTYLYVTRDELASRVRDCLASAYSERALAYRTVRGELSAKIEAAVVVQLMVDARAAGVLFTANPSTGSTSEAVITAAYGLGEGVVAGSVETDSVVADLATGAVRERVVNQKRTQIVRDLARGRGTREAPVPEALVAQPVLSDGDVAELVRLGRSVAEYASRPQDIEWAKDAAGRTYLLQTRPITTLGGGRQTVFDNANIVENYPGVTLPLTFSFARQAYEAAMLDALRRVGASESLLERNAALFRNLISLLDGRIYYNIGNWYSLYAFVPGTDRLLPAWERALGLDAADVRPVGGVAPKGSIAIAMVAAKALLQYIKLDESVLHLITLVHDVQERVRTVDLAQAEAHELVDLYEEVVRVLRAPFGISLLNDIVVQQSLGLMGRMLEAWGVPDAGFVQNGLLAGAKGIESVAPVRSALRLAGMVRELPELGALFDSISDGHALLAEIRRRPELSDFARELDRHLDAYADRTLEELKLETPSSLEDPTFLLATIRRYAADRQDLEAMETREREVRDRAHATVTDSLRGRPDRRLAFDYVVEKTRAGVRHRENMRLARSRAFGIIKRIVVNLGARLAERRVVDSTADVFYLTEDEVESFVRGASVTRDLAGLVALRKREYDGFRDHVLPSRVTVRGIVCGSTLEAPPAVRQPTSVEPPGRGGERDAVQVLRGIGCSVGRVTAPARLIKDPRTAASVEGAILVAPTTDPAWVFLMISARGLVTERGSVLSHTAIIGRELGVPTVVAVPGATSRIRDGEVITVDARAGTVTLSVPTEPTAAEPSGTPSA